MSTGVISKMLYRTTFPDLVLCLEQGEQNPDAGFLSWELLHHLHSPLNLFETPFNEVGCSYVLPSVCRMTHIGQTGVEIFFKAVHKSWKDDSVLLGKTLSLSLGFHEIGSIVDPVQFCFDQRPFTLRTLGLEIAHFMEETALVLTIRENSSDGCHNPWATVGTYHQDTLGVQPSANQLSEQGLPGFLALPVSLDEAKMLPVSFLSDPYSTQGRLPTDPLATHFEVGPVNDELSELLGEGPVQPPDQLLLDALVHPAHLGRTHIATPEQLGDLPDLARGDPSEKHFRDDLVNPLVLSAVAPQDGAVSRSGLPTPGQPQILNETKAGFQLPGPRPIANVFSQGRSLIGLGTDETEELVLRICLQHPSHESADPHLNVVEKLSDTFEPLSGFIQTTPTRDLINDLFSC